MTNTHDYYWLNKDSRKFLSRGYLIDGETAEQRIEEIANTAEKYLYKGFAEKFIGYMKEGMYSLSSPIWANFGRSRALPISCFGSCIDDTIESILEKVSEIGVMTAVGGGTSAYFGKIRGRGAAISSGGESTGSVHFMELYDSLMSVISQGSVRRGSFAAYLPVDHPDIEEFLQIKDVGNTIQDVSIGVCISDAWMKDLIDGDKHKRKIWGLIIKKRFASGYPYIFFSDNANNQAPQVYKDKELVIHNSNLCVTGDTIIEIIINDITYLEIPIKDLEYYNKIYSNIKVRSYDIDSSSVTYESITAFAQTGESEDLIEIEDEKGNIVRCTPEHLIFTQNRGYIQAQELEETDIIQSCS
jgi:ribonucleoside-diphosphate reductase alpha chain